MTKTKKLSLWFLICWVAGGFWGMGQTRQNSLSPQIPIQNPSIQEILLMIDQLPNVKSIEGLVKGLERKTPTTASEISFLIDALDHPRVEVQQAAVTALGNGKIKEAVPKLIKKLDTLNSQKGNPATEATTSAWNQNALVGETVVAALAAIKDDRAVEPLLKYPKLYTSHMGAKPLAAFGAKALPAMLSIADDPQDPRRRDILGVIASVRDPEAIGLLVAASENDDAAIRASVLSALRGLQVEQAVPVFEKSLADSDADVRFSSLAALVEMQPNKYFDRALLFLQDNSPLVRSQVVDLLARQEKLDAVEPLKKLLNDPHDIVKYKAAKALEKLTGKSYPYKQTRLIEFFEKVSAEQKSAH